MTQKEWDDITCQNQDQLVRAIRSHLLTEEQHIQMLLRELSIEDILNGRFRDSDEEFVNRLFEEWNAELGWKGFGF